VHALLEAATELLARYVVVADHQPRARLAWHARQFTEVREAVNAFNEKRKPDYKKVREGLKKK
jgi:1,4-dihydroxy-2-naphthoyl-CoA synthase